MAATLKAAKAVTAAVPPAPDAGLEAIAAWRRWFLDAHARRLRDDGLDDAAIARELVAIHALADAMAARMTADYQRRHA